MAVDMEMIEKVNPHGLAGDAVIEDFSSLCLYLGGSDDSWTGKMLALIAKSDPEHRAALAEVFPAHVEAWTVWQEKAPLTVAELTASIGCPAKASACRCGRDPGHEPPHACRDDDCGGQWNGSGPTFEPVRLPGSLGLVDLLRTGLLS